MANVKPRPRYQTIDGMLFPMFPENCIKEALNYKPVPEDIFIATYPKCGTTWMQSVAIHLFRKGKEMDDPKDFHKLSPFLESHGIQGLQEMPRPGAIKTHLPYTRVPYSPEAKYIYVLRNPKDTCVSMYYHTKGGPGNSFSGATFEDFFEIFMAGEVEYNDYFDHLLSWYPHRNDKQVFFTTYEDMKKDLRDVVLRLSSFVGEEYREAIEKDNSVLNNILHCSSFEYMHKNALGDGKRRPRPEARRNSENGEIDQSEKEHRKPRGTHHTRKGIVGDWTNHFSEELSERMNKKFEEKTKGTEIYEFYKSYMGL